MSRPRLSADQRGGRDGYVSLLAISFAFGLATLATVTAVSLRAYLNAAAARERLIVDRISLESATAWHAGRLVRGARHSIAPHALEPVTLNSREIAVELSLPEGKIDLGMDGADIVEPALATARLPKALARTPGGEDGLVERAAAAGLDAIGEDCLRRGFTFGRWPEDLEPRARTADPGAPERTAAAGDQIDLRAELASRNGARVLWSRVRLTGAQNGAWTSHDYRRLQLLAGPARC